MTAAGSTVRALTCPSCGGTIALRAAGVSVNLICEHCGTTLDATDPDVKIIAQAASAMAQPEISLGARGVIDGTQWEVVGYLERSDGEGLWSEYLLFNPYIGYAFLLDDGNRFSLGRLLDRLPGAGRFGLNFEGDEYGKFGAAYGTWVKFVVGEFYWRVAVGEQVRVTDYVRPGRMLSCEENDGERTWTLLTMLDRGVAETAFGIQKRGRSSDTPAPHEPSPYRDSMIEALIIGIVSAMTLLLIAAMGSGTQTLATPRFDTVIDAPMTTHVIKDVQLNNPAGTAISIAASADRLDNGWVDVDLSLVNTATDQNFDAYVLAERYSGIDSDGSWSEGSGRGRATLSNVPPGRYDLVIELTGHRWVGGSTSLFGASSPGTDIVPVELELVSGGVFRANVILAMVAILLWPLILVGLHASFEHRRMSPVSG